MNEDAFDDAFLVWCHGVDLNDPDRPLGLARTDEGREIAFLDDRDRLVRIRRLIVDFGTPTRVEILPSMILGPRGIIE